MNLLSQRITWKESIKKKEKSIKKKYIGSNAFFFQNWKECIYLYTVGRVSNSKEYLMIMVVGYYCMVCMT